MLIIQSSSRARSESELRCLRRLGRPLALRGAFWSVSSLSTWRPESLVCAVMLIKFKADDRCRKRLSGFKRRMGFVSYPGVVCLPFRAPRRFPSSCRRRTLSGPTVVSPTPWLWRMAPLIPLVLCWLVKRVEAVGDSQSSVAIQSC